VNILKTKIEPNFKKLSAH